MLNRERNIDNKFIGIAPDADLISVKAFDKNGQGTYLDVIRGIDWVVANKDRFGIRVLNLSFSAAGPTYEGFVKPDLVAPGKKVISCGVGAMAAAISLRLQKQG